MSANYADHYEDLVRDGAISISLREFLREKEFICYECGGPFFADKIPAPDDQVICPYCINQQEAEFEDSLECYLIANPHPESLFFLRRCEHEG